VEGIVVTIGDPCFRDRHGVAHAELPHRVRLADGSTRTDPSQWFEDQAVREETGWTASTVTADDLPEVEP
jgi:hypothetical protein